MLAAAAGLLEIGAQVDESALVGVLHVRGQRTILIFGVELEAIEGEAPAKVVKKVVLQCQAIVGQEALRKPQVNLEQFGGGEQFPALAQGVLAVQADYR